MVLTLNLHNFALSEHEDGARGEIIKSSSCNEESGKG